MKVIKVILVLLCMLLFSPSYGSATKIHEKVLNNGLKIIVKEDHRAPVVISQIWYRVGSAQEHSGITGVSHVLEHMMFKGTEKYPSGTFSSTVADMGARDNAFTGVITRLIIN